VLDNLPKPLPKMGMLNLFVKHTSCALSINENADPDVRTDMEKILNRMVKENEPVDTLLQMLVCNGIEFKISEKKRVEMGYIDDIKF
jgi:elongation factor P--beta-lysine ligase